MTRRSGSIAAAILIIVAVMLACTVSIQPDPTMMADREAWQTEYASTMTAEVSVTGTTPAPSGTASASATTTETPTATETATPSITAWPTPTRIEGELPTPNATPLGWWSGQSISGFDLPAGGRESSPSHTERGTDMFEFLALFNKELLAELLIGLIFVIYVVVYVVEALKKAGKVQPGDAGKWSEGLNGVIGLLIYVLTWIGGGADIESLPELAALVASGVAFVILAVIGSKLWYEALKWIRGRFQTPQGRIADELQQGIGEPPFSNKMDDLTRGTALPRAMHLTDQPRGQFPALGVARGYPARRNERRLRHQREQALGENLGQAFRKAG